MVQTGMSFLVWVTCDLEGDHGEPGDPNNLKNIDQSLLLHSLWLHISMFMSPYIIIFGKLEQTEQVVGSDCIKHERLDWATGLYMAINTECLKICNVKQLKSLKVGFLYQVR